MFVDTPTTLPTENTENELPPITPTGNIDILILPPRTEKTSIPEGCSENGKLYAEGDNWYSGPCETCNCTLGKIFCYLDTNCSSGKDCC